MTTLSDSWYRVPVVWLGVAILVASIAACVLMIVLSLRYPDPPVAVNNESLLKVPDARDSEAQP